MMTTTLLYPHLTHQYPSLLEMYLPEKTLTLMEPYYLLSPYLLNVPCHGENFFHAR